MAVEAEDAEEEEDGERVVTAWRDADKGGVADQVEVGDEDDDGEDGKGETETKVEATAATDTAGGFDTADFNAKETFANEVFAAADFKAKEILDEGVPRIDASKSKADAAVLMALVVRASALVPWLAKISKSSNESMGGAAVAAAATAETPCAPPVAVKIKQGGSTRLVSMDSGAAQLIVVQKGSPSGPRKPHKAQTVEERNAASQNVTRPVGSLVGAIGAHICVRAGVGAKKNADMTINFTTTTTTTTTENGRNEEQERREEGRKHQTKRHTRACIPALPKQVHECRLTTQCQQF
jgi:hypothetical protein